VRDTNVSLSKTLNL